MDKQNINLEFTNIANEYLANGYILNLGTMSGSQGEIAKVDVANEEEIIRIILEKFFSSKEDLQGYRIKILKSCKVTPEICLKFYDAIIWESDCELLNEICFYSLGRNYNYFTKDKEVAINAVKKSSDRYVAKYSNRSKEDVTKKCLEVAKKVILSRPEIFKVKRVNCDLVKVTKYCGDKVQLQYVVSYKNSSYILK